MTRAAGPRAAVALVLVGLLLAPLVALTALATAPNPPQQPPSGATPRPASGRADRSPASAAPVRPDGERAGRDVGEGSLARRSLLELLALLIAASSVIGTTAAAAVGYRCAHRRLAARRSRRYGRYEIKLSAHDETRLEDLEEAVEAIAGIVREYPAERFRRGQPYWALELHHGPTDSGLEWAACLVCEPRHAQAIDHALANAYPDVRVGHEFAGPPRPLRGRLARPRHVQRFRKQRLFIYPLGRDHGRAVRLRAAGAPLLELVAQAQLSSATPSTVRLQFVPAMHALESLAGSLLEWQENRSARAESWGAREAGLRSPHRQQELRSADRSQHRSLFWFEILVASDNAATCKQVGAALSAFRGENRLRLRHWLDRTPGGQRRLRDRFVSGQPPRLPVCWFNWLLPPLTFLTAPGLTTVVSTDEVARLIELPTARLKGVPVRRSMLPRIPAPPEVLRAPDERMVEIPADTEPFDEQRFKRTHGPPAPPLAARSA